jgi:serine O-acetyltransferase
MAASTQEVEDETPPKKGSYDLGLGKNKPLESEEDIVVPPEVLEADHGLRADGGVDGPTLAERVALGAKAKGSYDLGLGKNKPFESDEMVEETSTSPVSSQDAFQNWMIPEPVHKGPNFADAGVITSSDTKIGIDQVGWSDATASTSTSTTASTSKAVAYSLGRQGEIVPPTPKTTRRMVARDNDSRLLRGALWDEGHYVPETDSISLNGSNNLYDLTAQSPQAQGGSNCPPRPSRFYPDIDISIPESVYSQDGSIDLVWDLLRWDAYQEAQREPLLVSFLYSTILNHRSLESSLAFLLANRLQSPAMMISTQLQSLILDSLSCPVFRRCLRADMMAVRDRDPACNCLPDVFLYFKGFHALQSHRVAHCLWKSRRYVLAQFLQSQVSQVFQIDIHPNATMGSGIMLDHGTGIVIGETSSVGHNCSILHHVTLGGSGKKGVIRHPTVGNGVLLGAGATVLGPVQIGDGSQVGAGTLVISDLPPHCVAARIIGSFVDVTEQPSIGMNQIMDDRKKIVTFESDGI